MQDIEKISSILIKKQQEAKEKELLLDDGKVKVHSFPLKHSIATTGFLFEEHEKDRNILKEKISELGIPVCEAIARHAIKPLDVHLMIEKPERYLEAFKHAGAATLSVHYEACPHLHSVIQQIKSLDCKAGVAINPHTSVQLLEGIIHEVDLVCIMSVNPGFGGQKFIESTYNKIRLLKKLIHDAGARTLIEVDGGVELKNAKRLMACGADVLVAGNCIFKSNDSAQTISDLKNLAAHV